MALLPSGRAFVTADATTGAVASGAKFTASQITDLSTATVYSIDSSGNPTKLSNPVIIVADDPLKLGGIKADIVMSRLASTS